MHTKECFAKSYRRCSWVHDGNHTLCKTNRGRNNLPLHTVRSELTTHFLISQ